VRPRSSIRQGPIGQARASTGAAARRNADVGSSNLGTARNVPDLVLAKIPVPVAMTVPADVVAAIGGLVNRLNALETDNNALKAALREVRLMERAP